MRFITCSLVLLLTYSSAQACPKNASASASASDNSSSSVNSTCINSNRVNSVNSMNSMNSANSFTVESSRQRGGFRQRMQLASASRHQQRANAQLARANSAVIRTTTRSTTRGFGSNCVGVNDSVVAPASVNYSVRSIESGGGQSSASAHSSASGGGRAAANANAGGGGGDAVVQPEPVLPLQRPGPSNYRDPSPLEVPAPTSR